MTCSQVFLRASQSRMILAAKQHKLHYVFLGLLSDEGFDAVRIGLRAGARVNGGKWRVWEYLRKLGIQENVEKY